MSQAPRYLLTFLGLVLSAAAASAAPAVSVKPAVGPPTTLLTVKGTGFSPYRAVDAYFDQTDLCLTLADGAGVASCSFAVPSSAQPQGHWISMIERGTYSGAQAAYRVQTDVAQFHGNDARHDGRNPYENTIAPANAPQLRELWTAELGSPTYGAPVIAGGRVYVATFGGQLHARNAYSGSAIAGFPKIGLPAIAGSPAVGNGNVYVATEGAGTLYAFSTKTGALVTGFPAHFNQPSLAPPTLYDGRAYVTSTDGKLYAFSASTGAAVRNFPRSASAELSAVTVAGGKLLVSGSDGLLRAFDPLSGALAAGYPVPAGRHTPAAGNGQVFAAFAGGLLDLRISDGAVLFGSAVSAAVETPALGGNIAVYITFDGHVRGVAIADGSLLWDTALLGPAGGSPFIANGVVYVTSQTSLYALHLGSGQLLWRAGVASGYRSSPVVANGILYMGDLDGVLHAYTIDGRRPWARSNGGEPGVRPALTALKPDLSLNAGVAKVRARGAAGKLR